MYTNIPLNRMVLETDAPLLTPTPKRGKINVPAYMRYTLQHMADLHSKSTDVIAEHTSHNAEQVLAI
jgi:TatD DNase family protein